MDRLKEVARVWWKAFNEGQKDRLVRWQVEKTCLVALKEKGQPRPLTMLMRDCVKTSSLWCGIGH